LDANRARASPALMVATPRRVVETLVGAECDEVREATVERTPREDADRNCCRADLDAAGIAIFRRKTPTADVMVPERAEENPV